MFDERCRNLDAKLRVQMRAEISKLAPPSAFDHDLRDPRPGRSHDDGRSHRGHVERGDSAALPRLSGTLTINPVNKFVAGFIGSPPMNFLEGELSGRKTARWRFRGQERDPAPGVCNKSQHAHWNPIVGKNRCAASGGELCRESLSTGSIGVLSVTANVESRGAHGPRGLSVSRCWRPSVTARIAAGETEPEINKPHVLDLRPRGFISLISRQRRLSPDRRAHGNRSIKDSHPFFRSADKRPSPFQRVEIWLWRYW